MLVRPDNCWRAVVLITTVATIEQADKTVQLVLLAPRGPLLKLLSSSLSSAVPQLPFDPRLLSLAPPLHSARRLYEPGATTQSPQD